jgi:hypothetical protein
MHRDGLRALPNIGPKMARRLRLLGVTQVGDLRGRDPEELFERLCVISGVREDPCVLDTLTAAVDYAGGAPPRPWWYYSRLRKARAGAAGLPGPAEGGGGAEGEDAQPQDVDAVGV